MLYVKGMARMAIYAGMASVGSLKLMPVTAVNMRKPTMMRAGAVAKAGIARKKGERNRERAKRTATVTAVRPVRPPSETPAALSTKVVVVETPRPAPMVVATASAMRAPLMRGSFPSSSSMFALEETPTRVPRVSKISTKRNAKRTTKKSGLITFEKSSCMKMGDRLTGVKEAMPAERSGRVLNAPFVGSGM